MNNQKEVSLMNDTIVAVATPVGVGGIAVVRVSGPQTLEVVLPFLNRDRLRPRMATYVTFSVKDDDGKESLLDEVVATFYEAPHSYTGEDVVELSCHGSVYVQQTILRVLMESGARLAEPGEFTRRAFLNGRMDLSQAEAVADLIDSTNAVSHRLAISQLRGGYAQKLAQLRNRFVELTSLLELELDFSDEDVEFADRSQLREILSEVTHQCTQMADSFTMGNAIKNGIPVAILGHPNVGKSTLLNALVGEERAIVSDIPGTTRDTIEDTMTIGGVTFRFIDTAGLRNSSDAVESEGIARSYRTAQKALVLLYLVDFAAALQQVERELQELQQNVDLSGKKCFVVFAKNDVCTSSIVDAFMSQSPYGKIFYSLSLSAKTGVGLETLKQQLLGTIETNAYYSLIDSQMITNVRHYEAMRHIVDACSHVSVGMQQGLPADLLVVDIRDALYHLGSITGQVTSDEILGSIFSRFCIGK